MKPSELQTQAPRNQREPSLFKRMMPQSPGSYPHLAVNESVRSTFADPNWMFKTGIGGIFTAMSLVAVLYSLFGIPIMAALLALNTGYNLKLMREKSRNPANDGLPEWSDWGDLFLSGMTWIALQTCIWLIGILIAFAVVILVSIQAYGLKSSIESTVFMGAGCVAASAILLLLGFSSSFLMVHFAQEENAQAGFAYIYVLKKLFAHPKHYFLAYVISVGVQWASIIIPILSVLGIFLIPSAVFAGQLLSSTLLARAWTAGKLSADDFSAESSSKEA